jgi:hypothetical protein
MSLMVKLVPIVGVNSSAEACGIRYSTSGGILDLSNDNLARQILGASGWTTLPPHGPTNGRPTQAQQGAPYCDETLSKVVFAQVWPNGSGKVVGWCDMNGNAV